MFLACVALFSSSPLALVVAKPELKARGSGVVINEALHNEASTYRAIPGKGPEKWDPANSKKFVHFDCGTDTNNASKALLETVKSLRDDNKAGSPGAKLRAKALLARQGPILVPTVFHIVSTTANAATVLPTMPEAQIAALNKMYNPIGFQFQLLTTTWTTNDAWSIGAGDSMNEMKRSLRQGGYNTLNIYFHTDLEGGILGKCSMPSQIGDPTSLVAVLPSIYFDDGCSVNAGTMPGGSVFGYDQGMTAVHETGHWLGLFHTFEGYSCEGDGDFIADTPPQSESTDGCPVEVKDSCPGLEGVDAVHNIMDYSTDACYEGFSPLQVERMLQMWGQFRAGK
ncbi:zincin [Tothia fuscella]|uniref:Zincin n=1 Tax=Tothia fuscella TaxID=1048955 RepID=A0A9P4U0T4_9PEZI|nr:zincin [Tothia fuscella]